MLTKKHFEYLARLISSWADTGLLTSEQSKEVAKDLSVFCSDLNPRFDRMRFLKASMKD